VLCHVLQIQGDIHWAVVARFRLHLPHSGIPQTTVGFAFLRKSLPNDRSLSIKLSGPTTLSLAGEDAIAPTNFLTRNLVERHTKKSRRVYGTLRLIF